MFIQMTSENGIIAVKGKMFMSTQSRQWIRIVKFIDELRKNRYPNVPHMLAVFREADIMEGIPLSCSERTFRRDIDTLRNDYNAPIDFDVKHQGFYLTDPDWQFSVPVFNSPTVKVHVDESILRTLHDASTDKKVVEISYARPNCEPNAFAFEPHVLMLHHGVWYVRGKRLDDGEFRTLAVQRVTSAAKTAQTFRPNKQLIAKAQKEGPFDIPKITGAVLRVEDYAAYYFRERAAAEGYVVTDQPDGTCHVSLPPMTEAELLRFVLGGFGDVKLLEPAELRVKVIESAKVVLDGHRDL